MPVNIYRDTSEEQEIEQIAVLCDDEWELAPQIGALIEWLKVNGAELSPAEYVADVGFCWRRDAGTGGAVVEPAVMRQMAELGMSLYLSEYQGFSDEMNNAAP